MSDYGIRGLTSAMGALTSWLGSQVGRSFRRQTYFLTGQADGGAPMAVALPELDGITFVILGLHNCQSRTVVHMHASGPMNQVSYESAELYYWPVTWIRDNDGRWHATRTLGQSGISDGTALRVEVVPPLNRATTGIEVVTTGRSAEARARLPLDWE